MMAGLIVLAGFLIGAGGLSLIADHSQPGWEVTVYVDGKFDAAQTQRRLSTLNRNSNIIRWVGWAVFWGALTGGTLAVLALFGM